MAEQLRGPFEKFVDSLLFRVGIWWRCSDGIFFRTTSLCKRCTSYNAPPTSRKRKRSNKV